MVGSGGYLLIGKGGKEFVAGVGLPGKVTHDYPRGVGNFTF